MQDIWLLTIIIVLFSTVQSVFGVGLLVFGTPTLLLLGCPFDETIAYLLPSSVLISLMQVVDGRKHIGELRTSIFVYCVPCIVVGLALVLSKLLTFDIKLLVGVTLIFSAFARFNKGLQEALVKMLKRHTKLYLMIMGFVHGISNMGGGLLTIFATALYDDKERTRANIAYGYLVFAISQISVLLLLHFDAFHLNCLPLAIVALGTYLTIGNFIYVRSSRAVYQQWITLFMLAYGVLLINQELSEW
ncbi:MAG: TSUP family transporter [Planctomycetes bacterium]|nr:TSUP family transporter [Planctomycetota bacterium]